MGEIKLKNNAAYLTQSKSYIAVYDTSFLPIMGLYLIKMLRVEPRYILKLPKDSLKNINKDIIKEVLSSRASIYKVEDDILYERMVISDAFDFWETEIGDFYSSYINFQEEGKIVYKWRKVFAPCTMDFVREFHPELCR